MLKKNLLIDLNQRITLIEECFISEIKSENNDVLNCKPSVKSWSAIECIEHLNKIGSFYVSEFECSIENAKRCNKNEGVNSTYIGWLMKLLMLPKKGKVVFKMRTFKQFKPLNSNDNEIINEFSNQLEQINNVLKRVEDLDITDLKINSAIGSFVTFKLSDAFQFVIAHIERHLIQAIKAKRS